MENLLNINNLSVSYGVDPLYEDVSFGISAGEKVAVVGPNGCGKSTLFDTLAGLRPPDDGEITLRGDITFGYLSQHESFGPDQTARDVVAEAMRTVREALEEYETISNQLGDVDHSADGQRLEALLKRQSELQSTIEKIGGWTWEHRVEEMLDRLSVTRWMDTPMRRLSGGQRRRVDLARVLLEAPDLLMLDEPTNHLDTGAVEWLEGWLKDHARTLLFVTHDRYFLERIADRIIEIGQHQFYDYPGNYQTFIERSTHRQDILRRTHKRKKKELKKELQWLQGSVKSQDRRSQKRIDDIKVQQHTLNRNRPEPPITMAIGDPPDFGETILNVRGLWKSRGDHPLFEQVHLDLRPGEKLGLIGPNGCGKSTFLKMLAGKLRYDAGKIEVGDQTELAYLDQHAPFVDPDDTVYDAFGESDYVWIGDTRFHKQQYLKRFLFDRHLQKSKFKLLSGGQQRRFAIAKLFESDANLFLLDEPTNDLDLKSLNALEEAIRDFDGCLITVSHDRYFLNRVCDAIIAVEDHQLVRYDGDYDYYRTHRDRHQAEASDEPPAQKPRPKKPSPPPPKTAPRGLSYREKQRLQTLEEEIASAESDKETLNKRLSDPELYQNEPDMIPDLNRQLHRLDQRLDALFDEWSDLEERRLS